MRFSGTAEKWFPANLGGMAQATVETPEKPMQLNQLRGHFDASSLNGANVVYK